MRRLTLIIALLASVTGLVLAPAGAAAKKKKAKTPQVTSVSPMRVKPRANLTIRGRNFSSSRRRNTVIFAVGRRSIFVKPTRASKRRLVVKVPVSLERLMRREGGSLKPTRFTVQVAAGRFSRKTPRRLSPVVVPLSNARITVPGPSGGPGAQAPSDDCDNDGVLNPSDTSSDSDLISDSLERTLRTDPCRTDTDGDGVQDGFEYRSAIDLNNDEYQQPNQSLPYPGKRPYPNPLDPGDGGQDYDGDSLGQNVEQRLWHYSAPVASRSLSSLSYSDGLQFSVWTHKAGQGDRRFPTLAVVGYSKQQDFLNWATANGYRNPFVFGTLQRPLLDVDLNNSESSAERYYYDLRASGFDADGGPWLSDEERDEDADGLPNFDENGGRLKGPSWWNGCYTKEKAYYVIYSGTDVVDSDSDGDGVRDGADDQDHDDVPNVMELSRIAASGENDTDGTQCKERTTPPLPSPPATHHPGTYGRVNPFNPCLPDTDSRTCNRFVSGQGWAPFDGSPNWYSLN